MKFVSKEGAKRIHTSEGMMTVPWSPCNWLGLRPRDHVHASGEEGRPVLVQYDRTHKHVFADCVEYKGENGYAVERVQQNIVKILGYNRVYIKTDQEPAIKALVEQLARLKQESK